MGWLESIDWSNKLLSDLAIYLFSVLGFAILPTHLGRKLWMLLAWFLLLNIGFLLGLPHSPDWQRPFLFIVLGQLPWVLIVFDLVFGGKFSRMLVDVPMRELVLWQLVRLMGMHFVLAVYGGHVPLDFAKQVGFSELITALAAIPLYIFYRPDRGWLYNILLIFWNAYGMTSVVVADFRTVMSNPHLPFASYSREIFQYMTAYPQNWVYCFWFPIAIGMHAAVFYKMYLGRTSGGD